MQNRAVSDECFCWGISGQVWSTDVKPSCSLAWTVCSAQSSSDCFARREGGRSFLLNLSSAPCPTFSHPLRLLNVNSELLANSCLVVAVFDLMTTSWSAGLMQGDLGLSWDLSFFVFGTCWSLWLFKLRSSPIETVACRLRATEAANWGHIARKLILSWCSTLGTLFVVEATSFHWRSLSSFVRSLKQAQIYFD